MTMKDSNVARRNIPVTDWGKDHWSTLAYIETLLVDGGKGVAVPHIKRMRCDEQVHPELAWRRFEKNYPTYLAGGVLLDRHDDWSCLDDAVAAGFLLGEGTGIRPAYKATPLGLDVMAALRRHKATGGMFGNFKWPQ